MIETRIKRFHDVAKEVRSDLRAEFERDICDHHHDYHYAYRREASMEDTVLRYFDFRINWEVLRNVCLIYPNIDLSKQEVNELVTTHYDVDYAMEYKDLREELFVVLFKEIELMIKLRESQDHPSEPTHQVHDIEDLRSNEWSYEIPTRPEILIGQGHLKLLRFDPHSPEEAPAPAQSSQIDEYSDSILDSFDRRFPIKDILKRRHSIQNLITPKQRSKDGLSRRHTINGKITPKTVERLSRRQSFTSMFNRWSK